MAGFEKTAKTICAGRFPPPHRGPRRRSRLGLLTALDAARRPSPPHPQRGPRHRRLSLPPSVPRPRPVPPRLGVFNRHLPPWFCGANQETRLPSPLASSIQEWTPQLPPGPTSSTSTLRRHSTPVYLQSKDQAHDHTAWLTIHSSQPRVSTAHSSVGLRYISQVSCKIFYIVNLYLSYFRILYYIFML